LAVVPTKRNCAGTVSQVGAMQMSWRHRVADQPAISTDCRLWQGTAEGNPLQASLLASEQPTVYAAGPRSSITVLAERCHPLHTEETAGTEGGRTR